MYARKRRRRTFTSSGPHALGYRFTATSCTEPLSSTSSPTHTSPIPPSPLLRGCFSVKESASIWKERSKSSLVSCSFFLGVFRCGARGLWASWSTTLPSPCAGMCPPNGRGMGEMCTMGGVALSVISLLHLEVCSSRPADLAQAQVRARLACSPCACSSGYSLPLDFRLYPPLQLVLQLEVNEAREVNCPEVHGGKFRLSPFAARSLNKAQRQSGKHGGGGE